MATVVIEQEEALAQSGAVYFATSAKLDIGANEIVRATIENPVGSGVNLILDHLVSVQNIATAWAGIFINPTAGLPTALLTARNAKVGHPSTPKAVIKVDDALAALSGGTEIATLGVETGRDVIDLPPLTLPPGYTLGVNLPVGLIATGAASFAVYWWEEPA